MRIIGRVLMMRDQCFFSHWTNMRKPIYTGNMFWVYVLCLLSSNFPCINMTLDTPKCTWPLYYKRPMAEIKDNTVHDTCTGTKGQLHPSLDYNGIYLQGTSSSHVDLDVQGTVANEDFSLVVFAKAHSAVEGTIFHYIADSGNVPTDCIAEILLIYNATHTSLSVFGQSGEELGIIQIALDSLNFNDNWVGFAAVYDFSKPKLGLLVQANQNEETVLTGKPKLKQGGIIRVGGSFDNSSPSFQGDIICFNLFDSKVKETEFNGIMQECSQSKWPQEVSEPTCEGSSDGYFEIVQENSSIDSSYSALNEYMTASRIKCASLCLRLVPCVSFTVDVNSATCRLYDQDYSSSVVASNGVHYYRHKNVCC